MRNGIHDLALFGGSKAFLRDCRVGRPNTGDRARFLARINRALDDGWLSNMGPLMYEFEERIAEIAGVPHCVALCNATVGLEMLVGDLATGAEPGDEVIVPSLTFPATAHAVRWRGLRPVFADVEPSTGNIDPEHVQALITPRTRAILAVHLWGQACDVERLEKIARANELRLYFDAAHALGCTSDGKPVGGFGDAEVFSFHATKVVNSFEGGAVVTHDGALAARLRAVRNFGFTEGPISHYAGTNGKMSEAAAAMGLTSLEAFEENVAHNAANYAAYRSGLDGVPGVVIQEYEEGNRNNHHYLIVKVIGRAAGIHRDLMVELLRAENILAQPYFCRGVHQMPPYLEQGPASLPHTEELCEQLLALPTGPAVDRTDIEVICDVIRSAVAFGPEVTAQWCLKTAGDGSE